MPEFEAVERSYRAMSRNEETLRLREMIEGA
jgi:hypothetical protein